MLALIQFVLLLVFPALVIVGALRDAVSYTIPNWLSLTLLGAFFPAALAMGMPWETLGLSVAVGLATFVAGLGMFAAGWVGGGDAKLFSVAGLWLGTTAILPFLVVTALAGGALALALLVLRSMWLRPYVTGIGGWFGRLATPKESVPYGIAIAAGALAAFPRSPLAQLFQGLS